MVKQLIATFAVALAGLLAVATVQAGVLENAYLSVSDPSQSAANTTHTFAFKNSTAFLNALKISYCVSPSGNCIDPGAGDQDGTSVILSNATGGAGTASDWTLTLNDNVFDLTNTSGTSKTPVVDSDISFIFTGVENPSIASCTHTVGGGTPASTGTCYVRLVTYQESTAVTPADESIVSLTVTRDVLVTARVDPTFQLTVSGVTGTGQTVNGGTVLTSGLTTTVTTIPFGNLAAGTAKYASHVLTVTSNNTGGYSITAKMDTNLTGTAYGSDIDGYIGNPGAGAASTTTARTWTSPTGTTSGTHTGWLGVGTTDTGVSGRADNSFFTLDNSGTVVSRTTTSASNRSATSVYAIEVNAYQQSDNYTGVLTYNALPVY